MIRALIVDDEKKAIGVLRQLLEEHCPDVSVVAEAGRVTQAIQLIEERNPQLIFLDVEMPGKSGFDLLESCKFTGHVILVTAHSEFALKAFRFSVTDYLLKPAGIDELKQAVEKVRNLIHAFSADPALQKRAEVQVMHTLRIPSTEGTVFIYTMNIIRLEADGAYTNVFLDNGKRYLVSDYLKQLESHLDPIVFVRIHRSHVINLKKIKTVIDKHGLFAEMEDGALIEVAKRNKSDFVKKIYKK